MKKTTRLPLAYFRSFPHTVFLVYAIWDPTCTVANHIKRITGAMFSRYSIWCTWTSFKSIHALLFKTIIKRQLDTGCGSFYNVLLSLHINFQQLRKENLWSNLESGASVLVAALSFCYGTIMLKSRRGERGNITNIPAHQVKRWLYWFIQAFVAEKLRN